MAQQWGEAFPWTLTVDGEVKKVSEVATDMLVEWGAAFKGAFDNQPYTLHDDAVIRINEVAIAMVKEWSIEFPMPFIQQELEIHADGQVLHQINAAAIAMVQELFSLLPVTPGIRGFRMVIGGTSATFNYDAVMNLNAAVIRMYKQIRELLPIIGAETFAGGDIIGLGGAGAIPKGLSASAFGNAAEISIPANVDLASYQRFSRHASPRTYYVGEKSRSL